MVATETVGENDTRRPVLELEVLCGGGSTGNGATVVVVGFADTSSN
jgi:hypothetical protein